MIKMIAKNKIHLLAHGTMDDEFVVKLFGPSVHDASHVIHFALQDWSAAKKRRLLCGLLCFYWGVPAKDAFGGNSQAIDIMRCQLQEFWPQNLVCLVKPPVPTVDQHLQQHRAQSLKMSGRCLFSPESIPPQLVVAVPVELLIHKTLCPSFLQRRGQYRPQLRPYI